MILKKNRGGKLRLKKLFVAKIKVLKKMETKNVGLFIFKIVAIILGFVLFKQLDFQNLKFEKPWLAIIYIITFIFSIYYIIKNSKKNTDKD